MLWVSAPAHPGAPCRCAAAARRGSCPSAPTGAPSARAVRLWPPASLFVLPRRHSTSNSHCAAGAAHPSIPLAGIARSKRGNKWGNVSSIQKPISSIHTAYETSFSRPQHHKPSAKSLSLLLINPVLREGNGVFLVDLALGHTPRFLGFWPFSALSSLFLPDVRSPKSGRSPLYESTSCGESATGIFIGHWSGGLGLGKTAVLGCLRSWCRSIADLAECRRKMEASRKLPSRKSHLDDDPICPAHR